MATDDDPPDQPPRAQELRAKDLLSKPRAEIEQEVDAATLAELMSWFDRPNALADPKPEAAVEESWDDREMREARERQEAASAHADPWLLAYIARHETAPPPFKELPPIELTIDESITLRLVRDELERVERVDATGEERPYGVPRDIAELIEQHNAPQAILRDLFRPETYFERRLESPFDELPTVDPLAEAKAAMAEHHVVPWTSAPMDVLDEINAELREILGRSWADMAAAAKAWRAAGAEDEGR